MEKRINMDEKQNVTYAKKKLRKQILSLRNGMPPTLREEKSNQILKTLCGMRLYQEADILLVYVDYQSEVITTPLLDKALAEGKKVFAPKVLGEEMEFYQITGVEDLTEGYKGIREPVSGQLFPVQDSDVQIRKETGRPLLLMPGAVFDKSRHRIGYGKGFYDRYLNRLEMNDIRVQTLALCYECQVLEEIPYEAHDIKPEYILTEERLYL